MSLPLSGIKVIDFTMVQAGPACTQLMAWYGADVTKVERPQGGDFTRHQLRDIPGADALYFTMLNSNKKSLVVDLKTPEGKEVLTKMIRTYDVLVENFAPGVLDRLGLPLGAHPRTQSKADLRVGQGLPRRLSVVRHQGLRKRGAMRRRVSLDHRLLGRASDRERRRSRRQQHGPASADRRSHGPDRPAEDGQGPEAHRFHAGSRAWISAASNCGISSGWSASAIWKSIRSIQFGRMASMED